MPRDEFNKGTKDILAERVSYICSNPDCECYTIGPHTDSSKSAKVGVAAHITAAASGGPRYNPNLSPAQRSHPDNGIWLCENCSTIIDKDPAKYPVALIQQWKATAEAKALARLMKKAEGQNLQPKIEVDLLFEGSGRYNDGYSIKNQQVHGTTPVPVGSGNIYIHWLLNWSWVMVLVNNSSYPAFNIRITPVSGRRFKSIKGLEKVNNIPPYEKMDLEAEFEMGFEGTANEVDPIFNKRIPNALDGSEFRVSYDDESGKGHSTLVTITGQEIISHFEG